MHLPFDYSGLQHPPVRRPDTSSVALPRYDRGGHSSPRRFITLCRDPKPSEASSSHPPTTLDDNAKSTSPFEKADLRDTTSCADASQDSNVESTFPFEMADLCDTSGEQMSQLAHDVESSDSSSFRHSDSGPDSDYPDLPADDIEKNMKKLRKELRKKGKRPGQNASKIYVRNFNKRAQEFEADFQDMAMTIHRFPASMPVAYQNIKPMGLTIGPYNRALHRRGEIDQLKDLAVHHFIMDSGHSLRDIYQAVFTVAGAARNLYKQDGWKMSESDFVNMLVLDGCFLLQYIRVHTAPHEMDASLACCLSAHQACINIDIMLLENQLPWLVLKTLMTFMPVAVEEFCARMCGYFQIRKDLKYKPFAMPDGYEPPHLLAILRSCAIGIIPGGLPLPVGLESFSTIPSAIELEEIGIKLTASKTAKFVDMGVMKKTLFSKLYLPPLSLDKTRSCWLVSMAAFEVCTSNFLIEDENIAVCSYLCVLAMLISREEDVQALRKKRLLQGELSNLEMLYFFKSITMYLYGGPLYYRIMADIERYKVKRWMWIKVHEFVYKNFKTIIAVFSVVGVLAGIFKTLMSLDRHH